MKKMTKNTQGEVPRKRTRPLNAHEKLNENNRRRHASKLAKKTIRSSIPGPRKVVSTYMPTAWLNTRAASWPSSRDRSSGGSSWYTA